MAVDLEECVKIEERQERTNRVLYALNTAKYLNSVLSSDG